MPKIRDFVINELCVEFWTEYILIKAIKLCNYNLYVNNIEIIYSDIEAVGKVVKSKYFSQSFPVKRYAASDYIFCIN